MKKIGVIFWFLILASAWMMIGCGDDDDDNGGEQDSEVDTENEATSVYGCKLSDHYTVDDGNFCHDDFQCKSRFCEAWSAIPRDPEAKCVAAPTDPTHARYLATVVDFETRQPLAGVEVRAAPAMLTQTMSRNVKPTQTKVSDENGRVEFIFVEGEDLTDPIAEVVLAEHEGYYWTGTGVVEIDMDGTWREGSDTNNMLMIPLTLVEKIKTAMAADPSTQSLPELGEQGGAMGRAFRLSDAKPIEGAILKSRKASTTSVVIYPTADYSGFQDKTSSTGAYLIFYPGAGEKFDIYKDGKQISSPWDEGTTGSTSKLIFAQDMWVDDLPWCDNIETYSPDAGL